MKTYFIDLDGTLVTHCGIYENGKDTFLPGAIEYLKKLNKENAYIVLTTARHAHECYRLLEILCDHKIYINQCVYSLPHVPRILINDTTDFSEQRAIAINVKRDEGLTHLLND